MRNRLRRFMGSTAHSVRICTFHGFCAETIARFPEYFSESRFRTVSDTIAQIRILQEILSNPDLKILCSCHPSLLFSERYFVSHFRTQTRRTFSRRFPNCSAKKKILKKFQTKKTNPKTGQWKKKHLDEQKRIENGKNSHVSTNNMKSPCTKKDLWILTIRFFLFYALRTEKDFVVSVQEETLFLLADEFQDSNGAQNGNY